MSLDDCESFAGDLIQFSSHHRRRIRRPGTISGTSNLVLDLLALELHSGTCQWLNRCNIQLAAYWILLDLELELMSARHYHTHAYASLFSGKKHWLFRTKSRKSWLTLLDCSTLRSRNKWWPLVRFYPPPTSSLSREHVCSPNWTSTAAIHNQKSPICRRSKQSAGTNWRGVSFRPKLRTQMSLERLRAGQTDTTRYYQKDDINCFEDIDAVATARKACSHPY